MDSPRSGVVAEPCAICLEPIRWRCVAVPCNHLSFDFECLQKWTRQSDTCPLCKCKLTLLQYDWVSPDEFQTSIIPQKNDNTNANAARHSVPRTHHQSYQARRRRHLRRQRPDQSMNEGVLRRRYVYQHKLYSLHVGANRLSAYTNLSPSMFSSSEELQSRARTFARRELSIFPSLCDLSSTELNPPPTSRTAEFLISYIVSILQTVDVKGASGAAEDMLAEFLGRDDARLFWHEMSAWLRSPFTNLRDWDRKVQYQEELPSSFDRNGQPIWFRGRRQRKLTGSSYVGSARLSRPRLGDTRDAR